jgi:hypothetical protein
MCELRGDYTVTLVVTLAPYKCKVIIFMEVTK